MDYVLGETIGDIQISTVEEHKTISLSLAQQARKSIDIFTQDLESEIYSNSEFEQSIFTLSKRNPNTRIRILVQDSTSAIQKGHRLIKLSQQLTSSVFIHKPSFKDRDKKCAFMNVDNIGLIHQTVATARIDKMTANYYSPRPAAKLSEFFHHIWEHSNPDIQTRRIFL